MFDDYGLASFLLIFLVLALGATGVVNGATVFSQRLRVPANIIGLLTISIGASLPEFAVSWQLWGESKEFAVRYLYEEAVATANGSLATLVGTSLVDLTVVLGLAIILRSYMVSRHWRAITVTIAAFVATAAVCAFFILVRSPDEWEEFAQWALRVAAAILVGLIVFSLATHSDEPMDSEATGVNGEPGAGNGLGVALIWFFGGIVALFFSSIYLAELVTKAVPVEPGGADDWSMGIFIVFGLGCAVPEIVTCVLARSAGQRDLLRGGLLGSTLFNFVVILPLIILQLFYVGIIGRPEFVVYSFIQYTPCVLAAIILVLIVMLIFMDRVPRWFGVLLLMMYFGFLFFGDKIFEGSIPNPWDSAIQLIEDTGKSTR